MRFHALRGSPLDSGRAAAPARQAFVDQQAVPEPVQVRVLTLVDDVHMVGAAIVAETCMQRLVQIADQVAEPGEGLPAARASEAGSAQLRRIFQHALGNAESLWTVALALVAIT